MRVLLTVLLLALGSANALAQRFVRVADNVTDMQASNPTQSHTNVFVVGPTNSGIYSYFKGSTNHATLPYFATTYPGQTGVYVLITTPTGVGVTNQNAILSGNYQAGTNMVFVTNAFGAVTISSSGSDGTANWTASGTTNSLLAGAASVHILNATNYITLGGTTNRLSDDGTRLTYNSSPLITFVYPVACTDETTAITASTNKVVFRAPFAFTLTNVRASLTTAQASGSTFTVYFSESGTSVLSTPVTIDNTEKTSVTAATPPVISDTAVADDAELSVSVSQIGDGTAAGLKFEFYGYR